MSILKYPIRQATLVLKDQRTNRQARQEREEKTKILANFALKNAEA